MSTAEPAGVPGRGAIAPRRVSFGRAVREGLLPTWTEPGAAVPRCLRRSYHPSQEGSLRRAVEYLALSRAARTAAAAIGSAATA